MRRTILLLMLTILSAAASANDRIKVHNTRIPVITDRPHNILAEITIDDGEGSSLEFIDICINGLDSKAVNNVKVMYTGTMSALYSRTSSFIMKEKWRTVYE